MENVNYLTLSQLSDELVELFNAPLFSSLVILGEVKSVDIRKGTAYVTLIETDDSGKTIASMRVVIFASVLSYSNPFNDGDKVLVSGRLSYYGPNGNLSFIARKVEQYGLGDEQARIKAIYDKLKALGVFDPERKRTLPKYPHKIAIITSKDGAAYRDILDTLHRRFPVSTVLVDAVVQGNEGPKTIVNALLKTYDMKDVDLIIIGRGGGSKGDLMAFNDEQVVMTIASSPIPIITAIGHEIDTSLADYASDYKAITPTDAAIHAVPDIRQVVSDLEDYSYTLKESISKRLENYEYRLLELDHKFYMNSPAFVIDKKIEKVDKYMMTLNHMMNEIFSDYSYRLDLIESKMNLENPDNILKKGYVVMTKDGLPIMSTNQLAIDDNIVLTMSDGKVKANVKEVNKDE